MRTAGASAAVAPFFYGYWLNPKYRPALARKT
jgi:hypothetical protein